MDQQIGQQIGQRMGQRIGHDRHAEQGVLARHVLPGVAALFWLVALALLLCALALRARRWERS